MAKKCMQCGGSMKYKTGGSLKKYQKLGEVKPAVADKTAVKINGPRYKSYSQIEADKKLQIAKKLYKDNPSKVYYDAVKRAEQNVSKNKKTGGSLKNFKEGGFPDLTGDGKVTKADVLKGRGVIKKGGAISEMKKGGNWIQGAIKRPGAFSAKAKAAGKSTAAYAKSVLKEGSKASTRTKRQAALAQTLGKMRKKK